MLGPFRVDSPNSGEAWDARKEARCWSVRPGGEAGGEGEGEGGVPALTGEHALAMRRAGASLIGGCCRVDDGQIRTFREALLPHTSREPLHGHTVV